MTQQQPSKWEEKPKKRVPIYDALEEALDNMSNARPITCSEQCLRFPKHRGYCVLVVKIVK